MQKERQVLPARCRKCNTIFDMWPALQNLPERGKYGEMAAEVENTLSQSLCWGCRRMFVAYAAEDGDGVEFSNSLLDED